MFGGRVLILLFLIAVLSVDISLATPNIEWSKTFGGSGEDLAYSVKETSDLGYILAGYTYSYGAGLNDVYLIKTDSDGNKIWERTYGYSSSEIGRSVLQTQDGGYIIAGYTNSTGAGKFDVWLIKTNQNGNVIWNKTFGGTNNDYGRSVQKTSDGGYIIGGETYGVNGSDFYLIKTDSNGNKQWEKALGSNKNDGGYSVEQTSDGGYILAGYTYRYMGADPQDKDIWIIKTDSNANIQWEKGWGNEYPDTGYDAQQTDDGGYVVAGYFSSDSTFYVVKTDSNGNQIWGGGFGTRDGWQKPYSIQQTQDKGYIVVGESQVIPDPTLYNAFLVKIDINGNKKWNKTIGGSNNDLAYAVQQTTYEDYIIAGTTQSFGAGGFDVYLVKIYSDNPIAHCKNLKKDFDEEGIDCGGSCNDCVSCSNRIRDVGEEGVDCGGSCPECSKLKILAIPMNWKKSQSDFDNVVDTQLQFFIDAIPLKDCPQTLQVDKLDITQYNFSDFRCTRNNCGVDKIKPFIESKGINVKDYDHVIGFIESSPCTPTVGCSNGKDAAWVTTSYDVVGAHEIGHFYGLEDEYCSNQAGSDDFRCNDGNKLWWWGIIPIPPSDANYLDADLGCNASIGDCCSDCSSAGNFFGSGDYFICCEGNIVNEQGGRAIMSYADANGPRAFDNHSREHLATFAKLNCPAKLSALGIKSAIPGKIIDLNLAVYQNDSVREEYIHLVDGEANTYSSEEGNYNLLIEGSNNTTLFNYSFERYFGYDGPMIKNINYSALNIDNFALSLKIPYDDDMHILYLKHDNLTIFTKIFDFCNQDGVCNGSETHLSCWQDCKPWSLDGVCINRTDSHCDPDCAKQVDDDCWGVFNLSLIQGWNLVSSPIIPDENISILFGNSTLYSYSNGTWVQLNGNINLSAFWIYMTQNTSVEVAGAKVEKNNS